MLRLASASVMTSLERLEEHYASNLALGQVWGEFRPVPGRIEDWERQQRVGRQVEVEPQQRQSRARNRHCWGSKRPVCQLFARPRHHPEIKSCKIQ